MTRSTPRLVTLVLPIIAAAVASAASSPARGDILGVDGPAALTAAVLKARPGDEVVIEDGVWRDVHVRIVGNGDGNAPIRIRPATPGGLQITGVSRVRIGGSHLVVSGLRLRNIRGVSDWFQFREVQGTFRCATGTVAAWKKTSFSAMI